MAMHPTRVAVQAGNLGSCPEPAMAQRRGTMSCNVLPVQGSRQSGKAAPILATIEFMASSTPAAQSVRRSSATATSALL